MIVDYTGRPFAEMNGQGFSRAWNSLATQSFLRTGFAETSPLNSPYDQNPWVASAIMAKARALMASPLVVNTGSTKKPKPVEDQHPLQKFFDRPSKTMPRSQVWLATVLGMDVFTAAYWVLTGKLGWRQPNEVPIEAYPVFGADVQLLDETGAQITDRTKRVAFYQFGGLSSPDGKSLLRIPAHAVIRFANLNPADMITGRSTIKAAWTALVGAHNAEVWNAAFFANSADPGGWLTNPNRLSDDVYEQLKRRWNEEHQGSAKRGRTAILEGGTTFQPNTRTQKDMEFLAYLEWTRDEILAVLGVPKTILSITDDLNYATHQGQVRVFYENTILPLMTDIEDVLWTSLLATLDQGRYFAKFDLTSIAALNADLGERATIGTTLMQLGYSTNEINERLNLGMKPVLEDDDIGDDEETDATTTPEAVATGAVEDVAATALNGAQTTSLVEIVAKVADGTLPAASAIAMLPIAFPTIHPATAAAIIMPAAAAKQEAKPEPTAEATTETPEPTPNEPRSAGPAMHFCRTDIEIAMGIGLWKRAVISTLQRRLAKKMQAYFKDLRKEQAERLAKWIADKGYGEDFVPEKLSREDMKRILFAREQWDKFLQEVAKEPMADIVTASAKQVAKEVGGKYAPPNPLILEVQGRVLGSLVVVNKDTRTQIRSALIRSVSEGETIGEMQERIVDHVETIGGPPRALRIAVTETGIAQSTMRYESLKDAGIENHKWVITGRNTRSSHQSVSNQVRRIGEPFSNGLLHPHQLGAPAEEVVNCHCETVAVL